MVLPRDKVCKNCKAEYTVGCVMEPNENYCPDCREDAPNSGWGCTDDDYTFENPHPYDYSHPSWSTGRGDSMG